MLLRDIKPITESKQLSNVQAVKVAMEHLLVRHARLESFSVEDDQIVVEVEYEFPEHLPKWADIKQHVVPTIKRIDIQKGEMWKVERIFGAAIYISLASPLSQEEVSEIEKFLEGETERTN